MTIPEIAYKMKDGRTALIHSPRDEDIPGVLDYLRASAGETEFILRYPEECDRYTFEKEKALFDAMNAAPGAAMLIVTVDGKVAGNCDIQRSGKLKTRHRAEIGIALLKEYWGQGIGTRLFEEMIRIAEADPYITQLELEFVEGNTRARALYEKMGFRICGVTPDAFLLKDGRLLNEYKMIRKLDR